MKIGSIQLRNNLIVAPMAGVTDRPFRSLCKRLGAGMAVSEMVASNSLLWGSEKTIRRGNHDGEVEPKVIQIAGDEANLLQLAPGASALRVQGTTFDQDDRATEVSRVLYRADRFRFSLESHRVGGELRHVIGPASDAPPFPPPPATAGQARRK